MSQEGKGPSRNKKEHKQKQKIFKNRIHLKSDKKFSEAGGVCGERRTWGLEGKVGVKSWKTLSTINKFRFYPEGRGSCEMF